MFMDGAERLNNYMASVDEQLKDIIEAFNENMNLMGDKIEGLENKIDVLHKKLDEKDD